ncbi:hypothetical protein J3R83DRAFT_10381 [Lanmaoa asiatica]|nr:hypothetical protein J3R83DRAFT_10381 [Lanmaoa asiatica]
MTLSTILGRKKNCYWTFEPGEERAKKHPRERAHHHVPENDPKPKGCAGRTKGGYSIMANMGLEKKKNQYNALCDLIRQLVIKHFDTSLPLSKQNKWLVEKVIIKASLTNSSIYASIYASAHGKAPFLTRFEGSWATRAIMAQYLRNRSARERKTKEASPKDYAVRSQKAVESKHMKDNATDDTDTGSDADVESDLNSQQTDSEEETNSIEESDDSETNSDKEIDEQIYDGGTDEEADEEDEDSDDYHRKTHKDLINLRHRNPKEAVGHANSKIQNKRTREESDTDDPSGSERSP